MMGETVNAPTIGCSAQAPTSSAATGYDADTTGRLTISQMGA